MSAGGTYSATCAECHPGTLYGQHQGVAGGDVTCADCHNANLNVTTVVSTSWPTAACAACHTTGTLTGFEQHSSSAPVVAGTAGDYQGLSCDDAACHATTRPARAARQQRHRRRQRLHDGRLPRRRQRRYQAHRDVLRCDRRLPHDLAAPGRGRGPHDAAPAPSASSATSRATSRPCTPTLRDLPRQRDLPGAARRQARVRELPQRHRRGHARLHAGRPQPLRRPPRTRPPTPPTQASTAASATT